MSTLLETPPPARPAPSPKKKGWQRFGGKFLLISVLVHVLFGIGAAYYIVQTITAKRKLTFKGGPPSPNPSQKSLEHKVQMAKKQNAMSAPAMAKRIATTGLAKVTLPDMPAMPSINSSTPTKMTGMGGTGVSTGPMGGLGTSGAGGGGGMPFFGLRTASGGALMGTFYDLKQNRSRQPTKMTPKEYAKVLTAFIKSGWNSSHFALFFKGPNPLYSTQIFIPDIDANKGPSAFGLQNEVQPSMWIVLYKGTVSPPESGIFHFVGHGDDILMVKFNNRFVLAANWDNPAFGTVDTSWKPQGTYDYGWPPPNRFMNFPFRRGNAMDIKAGSSYPIEILIGEQPGGRAHAVLLMEKEGVEYKKDAKGNPILPIFRLAETKMPKLERGESLPPYAEGGPIWKGVAAGKSLGSVFDALKPSATGASMENKPPTGQPSNKPDIVGNWSWFAGGVVKMTQDHRVEWRQKVDGPATGGGTWQLDAATGEYKIIWEGTGFVDKLTLSADGQSLKGKNQGGAEVTGNRVP
jgi:hypothetical protein